MASKETSQELEAGRSEKKLWLIKVPTFVAKRWTAACDAAMAGAAQVGPELGRVRIATDAPSSNTCTLTLSGEVVEGPTAEGLPKAFNMRAQLGNAPNVIHSFADEPDHKSVHGRVDQRFDLEMRQGQTGQGEASLDPEYRKLSRERNRAAATKTRTAQVIDPRSVNARTSYAQVYANKRKLETRGEKKIIEKRVRMGKEQLESLLFRLFERQDFWNFQHLVTETDQPVAWLKEVLLEIAVQNKKAGPHRDHWQLKPEFRVREPIIEDAY